MTSDTLTNDSGYNGYYTIFSGSGLTVGVAGVDGTIWTLTGSGTFRTPVGGQVEIGWGTKPHVFFYAE
jgi:hypothetical protein